MGTCLLNPRQANDVYFTERLGQDHHAQSSRHCYQMIIFGGKGAGKTTLLQQLQLIYGDAHNLIDSYTEYLNVIRTHCISTMIYLLSIVNDTDAIRLLQSLDVENKAHLPKISETLRDIWNRYNKFQRILLYSHLYRNERCEISDNFAYFMENVERIMQDDRNALTGHDIINYHTNGVNNGSPFQSFEYKVEKQRYRVIDIHFEHCMKHAYTLEPVNRGISAYMEPVDGVVFVAALSDYCCNLVSHPHINALQESLDEFTLVLQHRSFRTHEIILFLNKRDIFRKRLRTGISLSVCFGDDWTGSDYPNYAYNDDIRTVVQYLMRKTEREMQCAIPKDVQMLITRFAEQETESEIDSEQVYEASFEFIRAAFLSRNTNANRQIYGHQTEIMDRDHAHKVMNDCQFILLSASLTHVDWI